jgi:hypothetical protein
MVVRSTRALRMPRNLNSFIWKSSYKEMMSSGNRVGIQNTHCSFPHVHSQRKLTNVGEADATESE